MAQPDIFTTKAAAEIGRFSAERTVSEQVEAVIQTYFNHPSLNGYSRMRAWPEYYNPSTERFDSLLTGFIGDTYHPGELVMSSQAGYIRMIQPFQDESGAQRWEGLTVSRNREGQYAAEMVNKYYRYENGEVIELDKPLIHFPLHPRQVLEEVLRAYQSFRVRYDLLP